MLLVRNNNYSSSGKRSKTAYDAVHVVSAEVFSTLDLISIRICSNTVAPQRVKCFPTRQ